MDEPLDLESRRRIFELIRSRPGTYMREMERELDMQVGMLTYHLRVLTDAGMVRTEEEGNHQRYFPSEGFVLADRKILSDLRNRSTRAILMHALDRDSINFSDLLILVGVSKSTLSYHIKRLAAAGLIKVSKDGGTSVSVVDPKKLADLLVWVEEDMIRDAADALIDIWKRMRND
ncbi:MAG: helix-turn-helix domain-containing protein [Methanomassiliicoccales archaeon]|nr:helix-turn-helix domain-containing protein [Methanomassiliicoccales archaeon]